MNENSFEKSESEQQKSSGETSEQILYAIHDTNPTTGEEFWYIRDPNSGEKTPINTQLDEFGITREVLPDNTLGRKVVQDLADDPERVKNLYGITNAEPSTKATINQTLPQNQRPDINPISLNTSTVENDPIGTNQGSANALAANTRAINAEISESSPLSAGSSVENPSEFSEDATNYREKLSENLDNIAASLMQKADSIRSLDMPAAARLLAEKTELVYSDIQNKIQSAENDYPALVDIHSKYFAGDSSEVAAKIGPTLASDSSTTKFNELLSHVSTIPELSYIAGQLVSSRHNQKTQQLEKLKDASSEQERQAVTAELEATENTPQDNQSSAL